MPITTVGIGAAVTPTVIKTYLSHYTDRKSRRQKPTAHISYDQGLHVIRTFLEYASHHTVEDLQAFTSQWVPNPSWVRTENITIPTEYITKSADTITTQLGEDGIEQVGGRKWWQWRRQNAELKGEWIEMRADYNARKQLQDKCRRVMLYVHGGAYFFGSVDEHRYQLQRHARKLKAKVFAPRYRLAPQFPFPCGLQDCLAAYLYLLSLHDKAEIILAGDSAGGGMVLSILCILRDQGLPLPAGAVLISPWVDLTHSFPSVCGNNSFDYIPAHGFMQKPSVSWPPPNDDDMEAIRQGAGEELIKGHNKLEKPSVQKERSKGVVVHDSDNPTKGFVSPPTDAAAESNAELHTNQSHIPGPSQHLSIEIEGKLVELRDQIQMYTTNQLLSHPLVSPVLQPSLGGLPPLLILTGGGEVLRDEQIYLAHKAADPARYPLGDEYRKRYDPEDALLTKYKPTSVYLQVWEDLCHVAPTLSFTRPAKYMYRSVAQFGAWALSRAQDTSIKLDEDDAMSIISESGSESEDSDESILAHKKQSTTTAAKLGAVGKAGDTIPAFKHHMIRHRMDRHGNVYPLESAAELPALQLAPNEVGIIKVGPVKNWMDAKQVWDTKYAKSKRRVQKRRIEDLARKTKLGDEDGETPPPSALAGRKHDEKEMIGRKSKKSFYLAMWSGWGSKHDEDTIKREEEASKTEESTEIPTVVNGEAERAEKIDAKKSRSLSRSRKTTDSKKAKKEKELEKGNAKQAKKENRISNQKDPASSNQDNINVTDADRDTTVDPDAVGVAAGTVLAGTAVGASAFAPGQQVRNQQNSPTSPTSPGSVPAREDPQNLLFLPKFKNQQHLRAESKDISDTASVRTGVSAFTIPDNASTMAVFAAPGVSKKRSVDDLQDANGANMERASSVRADSDKASTIRGVESNRPVSGYGGNDTPRSRRSVERLMSHQLDVTGPDTDTASVLSADPITLAAKLAEPAASSSTSEGVLSRQQMIRNPSSMAVVQVEGVVGVVQGGNADLASQAHANQKNTTQRPGLYDRSDTEFKTAMEQL